MVDVTVKFPLKNKFLFEGPFEKLAQKREDDECDETYEYELILTNPSGSMIEEPCHKATSESVEIGESSEEIHNGQPLALKHSSDSEQKEDDEDDDDEFEECDEELSDEDDVDNAGKSESRSPPIEFTLVNGRVHDRKASEEVSASIQLRYKLDPLIRWEAVCELEPVKEYGPAGELISEDDEDDVFGMDDWAGEATPMSPGPLPSTQALKPDLVPICTIGTGAFSRVEITRHRRTGFYYALKTMNIHSVVSKKQMQHVHNEKRILETLNHPFIVKMYDTAKDTRNLYMIMEFVSGGELFYYLRQNRRFPSSTAKFYAAEIVLALEYLHKLYIAYRDLKPENLMITHSGHIKLTDFGFSKIIHNKSFTLCGTPTYLAPEIYSRKGHNHSVDFWALGVLIFELMTGRPPFRGRSADDVQIVIHEQQGQPVFPHKTFSTNAKDIISKLLNIDPQERLGAKSVNEVKDHCWFERYNWRDLYNRNYKPPLLPELAHAGDTGNFDKYDETEQFPAPTQAEIDLFDDW